METELRDIFLDKPEMVIGFPDTVLSEERFLRLRAKENLAVVELAGRDSVAAAIKAARDGEFTHLLPTYVFTGTETGRWSCLETAWARLKEGLPQGMVLYGLLPLGSVDFWSAVNGRFLGELVKRYGFVTTCVGCHVYVHSVRIPLAKMLGDVDIISGERLLHNGRIKINQLRVTLAAYEGLAEHFGVRLLFPVKNITQGDGIKKIVGYDWEEGADQLGCAISGNYLDTSGGVEPDVQVIGRFLEEFAVPLAKEVVASYLEGVVPDHEGIARKVLSGG